MKKWGIVGALLFVAACVVGFIFNFDGSDIVAIGLAAFGVTSTVIAFIKKHKEKGIPPGFGWDAFEYASVRSKNQCPRRGRIQSPCRAHRSPEP